MTDASLQKEPMRYRLYYWLMNAALVYEIFAHALITGYGLVPGDLDPLIEGLIRTVLVIFQLMIVPLLIIIPWWRDEYADLLWKRTMVQLAFLMTVVPPALLAVITVISEIFIQGNLSNWGGNRPDWLLDPLLKETWVLNTAFSIWVMFTSAFVVLFQWNRWRDSR